MPPNKCGERHDIAALSFSTASVSVGISATTVVLNGLIMLVFIRNYKILFRRLFYKITFNIVLADFLNGLIADNLTLSYVIKEGMKDPIATLHVVMSHVTFFIFGTVSVTTIGILGIERQWAVLLPFSYRIGVRTKVIALILASTWAFSISMSLIYLLVGFYTSLLIFASTTVLLSFIIMIITVSVYYLKLIRRPIHAGREEAPTSKMFRCSSAIYFVGNDAVKAGAQRNEKDSHYIVHLQNPRSSSRDTTNSALDDNSNHTGRKSEQRIVPPVQLRNTKQSESSLNLEPAQRPRIEKNHSQQYRNYATEVEKRATKTFMIILIAYIISYLPTCCMMLYMNTCSSCDCLVLHVLRDLTYLSMASGCLLRPISFIFSLSPLRDGIKDLLRRCGRVSRNVQNS